MSSDIPSPSPNNQNPLQNARIVLITVFVLSLLGSIVWLVMDQSIEPLLIALGSIAALAEMTAVQTRNWRLGLIILAAFIFSAGITYVAYGFLWVAEEAIIALRIFDKDGRSVENAKVLFFDDNKTFKQYTDNNGIVTFVSDSSRSDASIVVETEEYQVYRESIGLSKNWTLNVKLSSVDENHRTVIVRVVNDDDHFPVSGAEVLLIVEGETYKESADSNGLAAFTVMFSDPSITGELTVKTDEYEVNHQSLTFMPEKVQDVRLNPSTNGLNVVSIEATEKVDLREEAILNEESDQGTPYQPRDDQQVIEPTTGGQTLSGRVDASGKVFDKYMIDIDNEKEVVLFIIKSNTRVKVDFRDQNFGQISYAKIGKNINIKQPLKRGLHTILLSSYEDKEANFTIFVQKLR